VDLTLLGTGSADGWPNPHCGCASCADARATGTLRGQTAALLDGVLLLDYSHETPYAAQRAGHDLTRLRHVLVTHARPDHWPAFLRFRSWARSEVPGRPLDVVGPPEAVERCRPWLAPDSPVRLHAVAAGDRLTLGHDRGRDGTAYDVRVLAADHGDPGATVLYDVTGPGGRLLHAAETGPLTDHTVEATRDAGYDVVLLAETFGDHLAHGTDHLDLATFPDQLRRLREVGAVTDATDVVAVHLSHHNPPTPELSRRLADWGARVVEDGTHLGPAPTRPAPLRTLVLGGARSGKSREAERLLATAPEVTYVATGYPPGDDGDWRERVRRHQQQRPARWTTEETVDLLPLLAGDGPALLVDCLTLWLTRVLDRHDAWESPQALPAVEAEIDELVAAWRSTRRRVVAVSNEVGQGIVPATASGRLFRDAMGRLNARLAAETEDVRWCVAGRVTAL